MPAAEQPKSLSAFVQRSHSEIIGEFSAFARTLMPPNSPMIEEEMRDHCKDLLIAIAEDLDEEQTSHEQSGPPPFGRLRLADDLQNLLVGELAPLHQSSWSTEDPHSTRGG